MNEVLYIRLNSHDQASIMWLVWSNSESEIIASGELASPEQLSLLTEKAESRKVIVIVPSKDVMLKSLQVPAKSTRAIRQAAPFMLEEELAQDVEQLFFAFSGTIKSTAESNCFVAVVKKALMTQWLAWLRSAEISCSQMIPEVLLLPLQESAWSAVMLDEQVVIRQEAWQGMSLDNSMCQVAVSQWQNIEPTPTLFSYSQLPDSLTELTINQMPEELPLALMAQQAKPSFNLLQGDYAVKNKHVKTIKTWAVVASLALFALLITVGKKGAELYQIKSHNQAIESAIINTYKDAFPDTQRVRVSTIKSQLKRKLSTISSTGADNGFLTMMAKLRSAYAQVPNFKVTSIKYDEKRGEIRLNASARDFQSFDRFKAAVEKEQLEVDQGAQNNQGDIVTGSISIKERS